ncbi:MAG: response regulator, partial [Gammaproteobacteria bacterium]
MNQPFTMPWSLKGKKVLIVDDYAEMRSLVHDMLKGFVPDRVVTANSGEQAIERMEQERFDLVLCDYNLGPGKDGQQVLEEARGRALLPGHAVFVMITAENTSEMVMGAIEHLPDDYIAKPFNRTLLASRVRRLMNVREGLGRIHELLERERPEQALKVCEAQLREGSGNRSELVKLKGRILMRLGRYQEAVDYHRALLREREFPWASLALGEALFNLRDYAAAQEVFTALIRDNPANVLAHDWLARTLERLGRTEEAIRVVQEALERSPRSLQRQRLLARLACAEGDHELAESAWRGALKVGTHSWYRRPDDFGGLARTLVRRGDPDSAAEVIGRMERAFSPG